MIELVKSISNSQDEILQGIIKLYCPNGFDLDPTYSKGVFYRNIPEPKWKFDIKPQLPDVGQADCRELPFNDEELGSIVFDPPFLGGGKASDKSIIMNRFGYFKTVPKLWSFYREALAEFYRILSDGGVLIVKSQDTVNCSLQWLSHVEIINCAIKLGFYPLDLFVLLARSRLIDNRWKNQQHARKFHSYFLVFRKTRRIVDYTPNS